MTIPRQTTTSGKNSGGDASDPSDGNDGSMRTEVLDNEEWFFKIKLEDEIVVNSGVVEEAMDLEMSPQVGDMIWVTFDADTKEVNKTYRWSIMRLSLTLHHWHWSRPPWYHKAQASTI